MFYERTALPYYDYMFRGDTKLGRKKRNIVLPFIFYAELSYSLCPQIRVYGKFDKWRILSRYYPIRVGIESIQHIEM